MISLRLGVKRLFHICNFQKLKYRNVKSESRLAEKAHEITKIRNVGVIAHIDAGKTTTSERMLYYSGFSSAPGNIDDGNTVTDFMQQERERGISITSAVVSFMWKDHHINLIDTPGHIDFTSEVECALRVLDGAVLILDASAGVEAQTMSVWKQALKFSLPQVAFLNKMDKKTASLASCLDSITHKLHIQPLLLQLPVYNGEGGFEGVVDLASMKKWSWCEESYGKDYKVEEVGGELMEVCVKGRRKLLEDLANLDEAVGERFLSDSDLSGLSEQEVLLAVSRVTQACKGLPVLCGTSLRNKGVQPLLNAMVTHLPDPLHHNLLFTPEQPNTHPTATQPKKPSTIAFAFKTMHTRNKQPITFIRLHSGRITKHSGLYNHTSDATEKVDKLLQIQADEYKELSEVHPGMIFAATGLKNTRTGDLLTDTTSSLPDTPLSKVPQPVFFCSIEPPTLAAQRGLDEALTCLSREDPSLKVRVDAVTGQTVLGGMGKLHLEVIRDRILEEYKIDTDLGPLQIAYQETMRKERRVKAQVDRVVSGSRNFVSAEATFTPVFESSSDVLRHPHVVDSTLRFRPHLKVSLSLSGEKNQKSAFSLNADVDSELWKSGLKSHLLKPIQEGLSSGFSKGSLLGYPVCKVHAEVNNLHISSKASMPVVSSCFSKLVSSALGGANASLLQPIMHVEVLCPTEMVATVLSDLSQRHSHINDVCRSSVHATVLVVARTPLANLGDFSNTLRTKTSGLASFSMTLSLYEEVSEEELKQLLK